MMDQLYLLWFLSISMLIGSFLSGMVPMAFKLSDNKSKLLALLGSGILVGTALAIIIPEGIDSLYGQAQPFNIKGFEDKQKSAPTNIEKENEIRDEESSHKRLTKNKTWIIGISLIVGFVLMLLIDQFTLFQSRSDNHRCNEEVSSYPRDCSYTALASQDDASTPEGGNSGNIEDKNATTEKEPINGIEINRKISRNLDISSDNHTGVQINNLNPNRYYDHSKSTSHNRTKATKVTPTLGLVIHAAADGIALGAAATTSHRDVEMIIFLAIMLHKAPAAFSLVVLLLHRGLRYSSIRRHLLAFSLSAPIAAIVTYYGLSQSGKQALRENNATGIAMLFSAGTFLFVATVHVLPELIHNKLLSPKELLFLIGGSFLPLFLAQTI